MNERLLGAPASTFVRPANFQGNAATSNNHCHGEDVNPHFLGSWWALEGMSDDSDQWQDG